MAISMTTTEGSGAMVDVGRIKNEGKGASALTDDCAGNGRGGGKWGRVASSERLLLLFVWSMI